MRSLPHPDAPPVPPRWEPWLAVALGVLYVTLYLGDLSTPGNSPTNPLGYWGWFDQSKYLTAARALSQFEYDAQSHHYPIGYPLLGAVFVRWIPNHPFFFPNMAAFVGSGIFLHRLARRFVGPVEAGALMVLFAWATKWELVRSMCVPWSTIPTTLIGYAMIWLYVSRPKTAGLVWRLTVLDGLAYLCRPAEAVILAPLLVGAVLSLPSWPQRIRVGARNVALLGAFITANGLVNLSLHDSWRSNYETFHYEKIGLFSYDPLVKFYVVFLDGAPIYRFKGDVVLEHMPWLVLCIPGAIYVARRLGWRTATPVLVSVFGGIAFYLGYNNLAPLAVYGYSLIHYFFWVFPILALFSWLSVRRIRDIGWKAAVPAFAIPIALVWFVRLEEVDPVHARVKNDGTVELEDPAEGTYDLIVIRGRHHPDAATIRVDGRALRLVKDFHMRRDYPRLTPMGGYVVHLAEPVDPRDVKFTSKYMRKRDVEFRRLKWSFTTVPPMVAKDREHDRLWGVDPLIKSRTWRATELPGAVGKADEARRTRRTDGRVGHLQFGPYMNLSEGKYEVIWYGRKTGKGTATVDVLAEKGNRRITEPKPIHVRGRVLARTRFTLDGYQKDVEFRLHVDDEVDITLEQVELRPIVR